MADAISFLRNGKRVNLVPGSPTQTVLDYLRLQEGSKGTKEGCNEGDCGACTVVLGRLKQGKLVYEAVNACILLVGQLHGCDLITVNDLSPGGTLHPIQQAMVKHHASQCGFCTPGFVMSLFALGQKETQPTRAAIVDQIAGNLCRCTGYRPIVDAALEAAAAPPDAAWREYAEITAKALEALDQQQDCFVPVCDGFIALPARPETLAALAKAHPDATIVSGATDVGLWVTKQLRDLPKIIHTSHVAALHEIHIAKDKVHIGATATYAEAMAALAEVDSDVGEVLRRIGSAQVRASGTVGGNIANGSPIGDMPPMLIALGATLHLRHGENQRAMAMEDFFIAYGKQDRKPGELVWRIDVPRLVAKEKFRAYKITKRFDQDISAVMFALKLACEGQTIRAARLAMGGMAATPKRATRTEQALAGLSLVSEQGWDDALQALEQDFAPISDMRASAAYRMQVAKGLLRKALLEMGGAENTRVIGQREDAA